MKKLLSCILAICMVAQFPGIAVYAAAFHSTAEISAQADAVNEADDTGQSLSDASPPADMQQENTPQEQNPAQEPGDTGRAPIQGLTAEDTVPQTGNLTVEILFPLPLENTAQTLEGLKAVLTAPDGSIQEAAFAMDAESALGNKANAVFSDLAPRNFHLEVSGGKFETYGQEILIQTMNHKIQLYQSHTNDSFINAMNTGKHPGAVGYGDVNEDGSLDGTDRLLLVSAIDEKSADMSYDLNGDGTVDLIDLQYFSYSYGSDIILADMTSTIITTGMVPALSTGSEVQGSLENLLNGTDKVSLKPASEEAISETNPVEFTIDLEKRPDVKAEGFTIAPPADSGNKITDGTVVVEYLEGDEVKQMECRIGDIAAYALNRAATAATVTHEPDGTLVIDLGQQIAIKKITIRITQTESTKLADIAKVEFLNGMEERIPAPEMNIPKNLTATPGDKKFTVSWGKETNVTGYEVMITKDGVTQVVPTAQNTLLVSTFNEEKIKNGEPFEVKVQSINGEWRSGYSSPVTVTPMPEKAPDPPENVQISGGYQQLYISWKKMEDTDSYTLYYRAKGETEYQSVDKITGTTYRLSGLKDVTEYEVYLTGTNDIGTSKASKTYIGKTLDLNPPITSNYKLINTENGAGNPTSHIEDVEYKGGIVPENKFAVADNDYKSSWIINSWDGGGFNAGKPSPIITFDDSYEMDRIVVVADGEQNYNYAYAKTAYWDEAGNRTLIDGQFTRKTSSNGNAYYEFNFSEPIIAKKIQVNFALALAYGDGMVSISEMKFYYYDSLEHDVDNLYSDALHISLAEGVTRETIDALETRANTADSVSGEYHPRRDLILEELANARKILNDENLSAPMKVDTTVTKKKDGALKFQGGLNAWQPLGITAHEGEELAIYVGYDNAVLGANSNLRLVATQYHAESGNWSKTVVDNLKVGKNEVTIPAIASLNTEHGGSLYVEYTGNNANLNLAVRVSGGTVIPKLDLTTTEDETERKALVRAYVESLRDTVPNLETVHNTLHRGNEQSHCDYAYDATNCILGATEIVLDQMMYSVSSEQILNGINSKLKGQNKEATVDNQTEVLYQSLMAMNQMTTLFYQHKGLGNYDSSLQSTYGNKNNLPSSHLNIRYMRMFAGAFMYAGGLHIGIEWGSIKGLATSQPVESDNGKYVSGNLFGWGIAHEIGHIINQPDYAIAEITNNYFSVLAQAKETNDSVRFKYNDVYEKVTSGTKGRASNVFTSLAMYWQLHLAYDDGYNYKVYDNYEEQFNNLFFARVDAYARNLSLAPAPDKVALTLTGDVDNKLMRLSCAAAQKNLLSFFEKWGLTPNDETIAYANQFEEETRNICYITDEARAYRAEGGTDVATAAKVTASLSHENNSNQVTISLSNNAADSNAMLGYEIYRNGKVVGFVSADETSFVDTIATVNNRVFTYKVVGYDKLLQTTEEVALDPIKVSHDGSVAKDNWSITTNMSSSEDSMEEGGDDNPEPSRISAITSIYNNDYADSYLGNTTESKKNPEIIVSLGDTLAVSAVKITAAAQEHAIQNFEAYVSQDNTNWTLVKQGQLTYDNNIATAYFNKENDPWLYTYDASYLKLVVKNQTTVSLSEIDILGPSGDNVELLEDGIGILKNDYAYDDKGGIIPKGSLIFTGEYKGNPAYNAVKLYDQNNQIIEGSQIIFAAVPEKGELGEISSGTWIYYIEPDENQTIPSDITSVRAELYRVDDAQTNQGERLVSDTLNVSVPNVLPEITLNSNKTGQ